MEKEDLLILLSYLTEIKILRLYHKLNSKYYQWVYIDSAITYDLNFFCIFYILKINVSFWNQQKKVGYMLENTEEACVHKEKL